MSVCFAGAQQNLLAMYTLPRRLGPLPTVRYVSAALQRDVYQEMMMSLQKAKNPPPAQLLPATAYRMIEQMVTIVDSSLTVIEPSRSVLIDRIHTLGVMGEHGLSASVRQVVINYWTLLLIRSITQSKLNRDTALDRLYDSYRFFTICVRPEASMQTHVERCKRAIDEPFDDLVYESLCLLRKLGIEFTEVFQEYMVSCGATNEY